MIHLVFWVVVSLWIGFATWRLVSFKSSKTSAEVYVYGEPGTIVPAATVVQELDGTVYETRVDTRINAKGFAVAPVRTRST